MTIRTILVLLDDLEGADVLVRDTCVLARRFDAHLTGIHLHEPTPHYPGIDGYIPSEIGVDFEKRQRERGAAIKRIFERYAEPENFASEFRDVRKGSLSTLDRFLEHARPADLIVIAKPSAERNLDDLRIEPRSILIGCGRPVLVLPPDGEPEDIGRNVLIGWSPTREATRAAHDLLPFLTKGSRVKLAWVSQYERSTSLISQSANQMAAIFSRHGAVCEVEQRADPVRAIGDVLIDEAFETGCDLIATGAYGHSGFYDFIIGATTTHLLKHTKLPLLLSH